MEKAEKISVSDLSVGDYVRVKMCKWDYDDPDTLDAKVLSILGDSVGVGYDECGIVMSAFVEDLQPIPITAEVLEKNGLDGAEFSALMRLNNSPIAGICPIEIKYIHELQHILRLTKTDKQITL